MIDQTLTCLTEADAARCRCTLSGPPRWRRFSPACPWRNAHF